MDLYDYALIAIGLALAIEFFTTVFRLVFHLKSAPIQKKLHRPRIHHAYPGVALMLSYIAYPNPWLLVIGFALIASDLMHHLIIVPLVRFLRVDLKMVKHKRAHLVLQRSAGVVLISAGVVALVTPFTPGSWLTIVGLVLLVGKNKTRKLLVITLTPYLYYRLPIEYVLAKVHLE